MNNEKIMFAPCRECSSVVNKARNIYYSSGISLMENVPNMMKVDMINIVEKVVYDVLEQESVKVLEL